MGASQDPGSGEDSDDGKHGPVIRVRVRESADIPSSALPPLQTNPPAPPPPSPSPYVQTLQARITTTFPRDITLKELKPFNGTPAELDSFDNGIKLELLRQKLPLH